MRVVLAVAVLTFLVSVIYGDDTGGITEIKEMYLDTALVADGESACLIVVPDDEAYMPVAEKLSAGIEAAYGVAPPIRKAGQVSREEAEGTHLIALGVFANNHIVEQLYFDEFVLCDYYWPGGDSYVIRTVHNPWLTGKNVIYLGSTQPAACEAAVEHFIGMLPDYPDGVVGPIIEVVQNGQGPEPPSEEAIADAEKYLTEAASQTRVYSRAQDYCNRYFITGQPAWADLFLKALRRIDEMHQTQGAVAATACCQWLFHWFDAIEEGPAFSEQQRRELTELMYRFSTRQRYTDKPLEPLKRSYGNTIMSSAYAALYWSRYYPDLELGKLLLSNMDEFYKPDMQAWKPPEDCPRYGQLTVVRSFRWALHRPDHSYIENGLLKQIADYYMLITNNLGNCSGFGDYSGLRGQAHLVEVYPLAAWMYKDGRYLWWWDHFAKGVKNPSSSFYRPRGQGLIGWVPPEVLGRERPDDLLGITRAPLDQWIYDRRNYEEERAFPIDECFDKVSLRAGFEPDEEYMCISGFSWGYHSHPDANAIVNFTDDHQTLLYDDGYMVAQPSEHNTVIVLKDGWTTGVPELSQVVAEADYADIGIFKSRLSDYNGVDWDRCVIWSKSRYFLVIDDLQATASGSYDLQCIWRALGKADLQGRRWVSDNSPAKLNLVICSDANLAQKPSAGTSINAPPFPADKARRLVESVGVELQPGESYQFANLLYSTPDTGQVQHVEALRLGQTTTYVIDDDGTPAVAGITASEGIEGLRIEAAAFHLADNKLTAAGATALGIGDILVSADAPVNLQADLTTGKTLVENKLPVQLTIAGEGQVQKKLRLNPGRHTLSLPAPSAASLQGITAQLRDKLQALTVAHPAKERPAVGSGQGVSSLWEYSYPISAEQKEAAGKSRHLAAVEVTDTDGDGKAEAYLASMDNAVRAIGPDGQELWRYELPGVIHDLAIVEGADGTQIVAGADDGKIYALKPDGSLNWSLLVPARSWARPGYHEGDPTLHQGKPVVLLGADLDNDGDEEIVCGSHYGHVYAFDRTGQLLWDDVSHTPHSMSSAAACDLDSDGKLEVVITNVYSSAHIFSATGQKIGSAGGSGHAGGTCVTCADVDGDGTGEIAVGDKLGIIWLQAQDEAGKWHRRHNMRRYNAGSDITAVAGADLTGDGKLETAVASKNFILYVFDAEREPLWHLNLADVCVGLDLADVTGDGKSEIICGCEDGQVKIVSAEGEVIGWYQVSDAVRRVRACKLDGKADTSEIIVTCEDGTVHALQVTLQ